MLEVCTGSRLHFGLMELAEGESLRFGGLGLMLEQPKWRLRFSIVGKTPDNRHIHAQSEGNRELDERIAQVLSANDDAPQVSVEVLEMLDLHCGLGSGTQLAAATAVGQMLTGCVGPAADEANAQWRLVGDSLPELTANRLAEISGRGLRSAVGLQGFLGGGMILDEGYERCGAGRKITTRTVVLPADWHVVLLRPRAVNSVSGEKEANLLQEIAQLPNPNKCLMHELASRALDCLSQSAADQNFDTVMPYLEEYMLLAARLFAGHQGGLYNGQAIAEAVAHAHRVGLRGVGQSSWGPTVFGFAPNSARALEIAGRLGQSDLDVSISKPASNGACWRVNKQAVPRTDG